MKIITRMMLVLALLFGGLAGCNSQGGVGPLDPNRVYIPKDALTIDIYFDEDIIDSQAKSAIVSALRAPRCSFYSNTRKSSYYFTYLDHPPAFDFPFSPGIRYLRVRYKNGEAPRELVIDGMLNRR